MDANAVRIAAVQTLVALREHGFDLKQAKPIDRASIPDLSHPENLLADTIYTLMLIPALIDEHKEKSDYDATYRLGAAHSVLWCTGTLTQTEIEEISRRAVAEATSAQSSEMH